MKVIEVERKYIVRNSEVTRSLLRRVATQVSSAHIYDTYFRCLSEDDTVRLRTTTTCFSSGRCDSKTHLTLKRRKGQDREETEVPIDRDVFTILKAVDFPCVRVYKGRETFSMNNVTVCLDRLYGFGHYLEVEVLVTDPTEIDKATASVEAVAAIILGPNAEQEVKTYLEIVDGK